VDGARVLLDAVAFEDNGASAQHIPFAGDPLVCPALLTIGQDLKWTVRMSTRQQGRAADSEEGVMRRLSSNVPIKPYVYSH
jgi:hypothetical protein